MLKRVGAVLAGFLLIGLLGFLTDAVLQQLGILPIPTEQKFEPRHSLLALSYHLLFALLGGFVTAWLAPDHPIAHAITLGIFGIVISTLGLIAIIMQDFAPAWYGWALIVFSLPFTWIGGRLAVHILRTKCKLAHRRTRPAVQDKGSTFYLQIPLVQARVAQRVQ